MAMGFATSLPNRAGAVPCGASAILPWAKLGVEAQQHRFGSGDGSEELHHQVAQEAPSRFQARDDQRPSARGQNQRECGIYQLGPVGNIGVPS